MTSSSGPSPATDRPSATSADPVLARTLARHPRPLGGDPLKMVDRPVLSLSDRIINNAGGAKDQIAVKRKPPWLRAKVPGGPGYQRLRDSIHEFQPELKTTAPTPCLLYTSPSPRDS